jgi:uncharacterized protein (DUF2237 family)
MNIIARIEKERQRLDKAVQAAIQKRDAFVTSISNSLGKTGKSKGKRKSSGKPKRHMSAAAKRKQSLAAKARWREAKKAGKNRL